MTIDLFGLRRGFNGILCFAPDSGSPAGGSADDTTKGGSGDDTVEGGDGDDDVYYTEKELKAKIEESMKRHRRTLQRTVKEKEKEAEELAKKLKEQEIRFKDLEEQLAKRDGDDPELKGRLELMERKHERALAELREQVEASEQARLKAENDAKITRRDTLLRAEISKTNCLDSEAAFILMRERVFWDEVEDDWRLRTNDGNVVDFTLVGDLLPEWLKPASTRQGGSGTRTGTPAKRKVYEELESAKKAHEQLTAEARRNPKDVRLVDAWQHSKKKLAELQQQFDSLK